MLYVPRHAHRAAGIAVRKIHDAVASHLHAPTSLFARRLAPGLAVAEDPGPTTSFGVARAAVCARGLLDVRSHPPHERGALLTTVLRTHGVDPEQPHLVRSLVDVYHLESRESDHVRVA